MPELDHSAVWEASRPYLRARKNDIHVPMAYEYARRLLEHHPEADAEVVLLAVLLHDNGWAVVDQDKIFSEGFGPNMMESDVRIAHEKEGARIAREILGALDYPDALIDAVVTIVDGHDTRAEPLDRNDELVKDADALWRFTITATAVVSEWRGWTPDRYARHVAAQIDRLFTDAAREIATAELAETQRVLRFAELDDRKSAPA